MMTIELNQNSLQKLDISPVTTIVETLLEEGTITSQEQKITFKINYERDETDPRELSEIPEIRLWFVRLDSIYPWFPFLLDWKAGELARYTAMLVPHQFHRTEGIQYNLEALEIFVMNKVFILNDWLKKQNIPSHYRLKSMAQIFGYELDDQFFELLG
ncbi:Domain of unknown function DUF1817 [Gloeothece citriformis PCC 7424]|uniref:CRR6 family NdhI maturation factor n=1 Tax=Gloeothece citriformis (strain PCC 7424) TaxID=65393 RepID=B7KIW6_GLOC7|nr:CRR6 family NdhI maturation factor [Gloeothece citriformis]ACK70802.1 Domain of unknown function DUF1817 [Gloeothece citriformis PCC 7424]